MKVVKKRVGEDGKVDVLATATVQEVARALDKSKYAFASQLGVRPQPGMHVDQLIQQQLGISDADSMVRDAAIERLVPMAIDKLDIIPAWPPAPHAQQELRRGREYKFSLSIVPKPQYELESYGPVEITVQPLGVDERAVERELERVKAQFPPELVATDPHPVGPNENCLLKLESYVDGKKIDGLTFDSRPYVTGAGYMPQGFDEQIVGMDVGETKTFVFEGPDVDENGEPTTMKVDCTATVLEIQKEVKPTLSDEWLERNMPWYHSTQDLLDDVKKRVEKGRAEEYEAYKRDLAAAELAKRFTGKISDEAYEAMSKSFMDNMRARIAQDGQMTFEQFVDQQGGERMFNMQMMLQVRQLLVQDYALDALYRHEHLIATDEDVLDACRSINPQQAPEKTRTWMTEEGRSFVLRELAERIRASKWLLDHAKVKYADAD